MKLPRYLQVALLATAVAVAWSHFSEDESALVTPQMRHPVTPQPVKPSKETASAPRPERVDLFPSPKADVPQEQAASVEQAAPAEPTTPDLPLHALGAWWSDHQRIIILTDGVETWPVCRQCNAAGNIWLGSEPVSGWKLKAVGKDHLLFEWQSTHAQRRLELGELQLEPKQ